MKKRVIIPKLLLKREELLDELRANRDVEENLSSLLAPRTSGARQERDLTAEIERIIGGNNLPRLVSALEGDIKALKSAIREYQPIKKDLEKLKEKRREVLAVERLLRLLDSNGRGFSSALESEWR